MGTSPQTAQASPATIDASPLIPHVSLIPSQAPSPAFSVPVSQPAVTPSAETRPAHALSPAAPNQPRMRSQIACAHCRRSKVKCVNTGTDSVCKDCHSKNRQCTYPEAGSSSTRRESIVDRTGEVTAPRTKKRRAAPNTLPQYPTKKLLTPAPADSASDPTTLTPQIWNELCDIFQQHYATDLPFLHPPTFRNEVQQLSLLFRLSFLALTARFHSSLVARHGGNPYKAAEFYAEAARKLVATEGVTGTRTLPYVQALLMLGLHEWGSLRGKDAWQYLGMAIRNAQQMRLHSEPHLEDQALHPKKSSRPRDRHRTVSSSKKQEFIEKEKERRTFWSCFIMDRYLSFNHYQTQMIHLHEVHVQLPCSDRAFIFGHEVDTMMLGESQEEARSRFRNQNWERRAEERRFREQVAQEPKANAKGTYIQPPFDNDEDPREEIGDSEGLLSRFIRALDFYGEVMRWACTGGRFRRKESGIPPWKECEFLKLRLKLEQVQSTLPPDLKLTSDNTNAHIADKTSRHYALMHIVHLLCAVALFREYMAYFPVNEERPNGPIDEPTFPANKYPLPYPRYWIDQARECFLGARNIIDLLTACQVGNVLVETPFSAFANWQATTCGIYASFFPKMDVNSSMSTKWSYKHPDGSVSPLDASGFEAYKRTVEMTKHMTSHGLLMAEFWGKYGQSVITCMEDTKKKWEKDPTVLKGGHLKQYNEVRKVWQEFGDIRQNISIEEDTVIPDANSSTKDHEEVNESGSGDLKRERVDMDPDPRAGDIQDYPSSRPTQFTPVNHAEVKLDAEKRAFAAEESPHYSYGTHMAGHHYPPALRLDGYRSDRSNYAPAYAPMPAESAQRTSLNLHEHGPSEAVGVVTSVGAPLEYLVMMSQEEPLTSWNIGGEMEICFGGISDDTEAAKHNFHRELANNNWMIDPVPPQFPTYAANGAV